MPSSPSFKRWGIYLAKFYFDANYIFENKHIGDLTEDEKNIVEGMIKERLDSNEI